MVADVSHAAERRLGLRRFGRAEYAADKSRLAFAQTKANILRGEYGPYRANNDLLYYHLDVRVDPEMKTISGKNTIRFKDAQGRQPHPTRSAFRA